MSKPVGQRPTMPHDGVETPGWSPLPWSWAAERLTAERNYWVVTASESGRPHSMPVWGVWDEGELRFAFSCGPRARKASNLRANPQSTVTTESTVEALSVEGRGRRGRRRPSPAVDRALPRQVHPADAGADRRLPAGEPDVRVHTAASTGDHRARAGVLRTGDPLVVHVIYSQPPTNPPPARKDRP